jgi:hypothetical protein
MYNCSCATGYDGANCQTNIDDCASNPCQNGGTCADGVNTYNCSCDETGYTGENCKSSIGDRGSGSATTVVVLVLGVALLLICAVACWMKRKAGQPLAAAAEATIREARAASMMASKMGEEAGNDLAALRRAIATRSLHELSSGASVQYEEAQPEGSEHVNFYDANALGRASVYEEAQPEGSEHVAMHAVVNTATTYDGVATAAPSTYAVVNTATTYDGVATAAPSTYAVVNTATTYDGVATAASSTYAVVNTAATYSGVGGGPGTYEVVPRDGIGRSDAHVYDNVTLATISSVYDDLVADGTLPVPDTAAGPSGGWVMPAPLLRSAITMNKKIGSGNFGEVWEATASLSGATPKTVAVKMLKAGSPEKERRNLFKEAMLMAQLSGPGRGHPNLISLVGLVEDGVGPTLVVIE